eukprot:CAMPEP_0168319740 /NCGR_PEP_ID=MMETSP0213-20121227/1238_1 /TAXON_ID=151035 /ORGANISM="Euplotes harpa, Strain FSP1.4" /LENGTH=130 /DNA_ID=CAMNT_0008321023 /DNA_START=163 /DNA_END=556 /DNA_ORIENTATION=-
MKPSTSSHLLPHQQHKQKKFNPLTPATTDITTILSPPQFLAPGRENSKLPENLTVPVNARAGSQANSDLYDAEAVIKGVDRRSLRVRLKSPALAVDIPETRASSLAFGAKMPKVQRDIHGGVHLEVPPAA